ncbi:MAG: MaoC family dehydratase N-terminal domain-containing protein [Steroidobacteraceae bacterium]|jgi:acyl dehydratase|nr:MaoC family dehydratase N-terminal domain-containing protein [Steroidobacteraceae bacterium]
MAFDPARVLGLRCGPVPLAWSAAEAAAYAAAVGASGLPEDAARRRVRSGGAVALPTFAATLARRARPDFGTLGIDPARVLHLSQGLRLHAPFPADAQALGECDVTALYDAGPRGAILDTRTTIRAASGRLLAAATARYLVRGAGGFGGTPLPPRKREATTAGPTDAALDIPTRPDQAELYSRLGDTNPIHLDASAAGAAGFERPILHGLCTFGLVGLAVVQALCEGDPGRLSALDLEFFAPVYPGATLRLDAWRRARGAGLALVVADRGAKLACRGRCVVRSAAATARLGTKMSPPGD